MGAWGPGLRENDTALDALGVFRHKLAGDPGKLLSQVMEYFGEEATEAVLGVAEALLELQPDLGDGGRLIASLCLRDAFLHTVLSNWQDPARRVKHLYRFCLRLHRITAAELPTPGPSWKEGATRLRKELDRYLRGCRGNSRKAFFEVIDRADELGREGSPRELLGWMEHAVNLLEGDVVQAREFGRFVRAIRKAAWKLPKAGLRAIVKRAVHPAVGRLLGGLE